MRVRKARVKSPSSHIYYKYDFMRQADTPHSFRGLARWMTAHGYSNLAHVGELYQTLGLTAAQALYFEKKRLKKRFPMRSNLQNKEAALENLKKWGYRIR